MSTYHSLARVGAVVVALVLSASSAKAEEGCIEAGKLVQQALVSKTALGEQERLLRDAVSHCDTLS
ncbi:MAG: hypothetical protein KDD44_02480, partial [Bdellovibrionales bacterium]|nr:hypothetical protein [Bdellovibrionales bacterium]